MHEDRIFIFWNIIFLFCDIEHKHRKCIGGLVVKLAVAISIHWIFINLEDLSFG